MLSAKFSTHLTTLSLSLLTCSWAYANDAVDVAQPLETIVVKGQTSLPDQTEKTNSYTISHMDTASGLKLAQKDTPQSVSVITQQQLKDQSITSLADALKKTTGITVLNESGSPRFQSRGFYIDQMSEDGVSNVIGGSDLNIYNSSTSTSDLDIYDHVEVLRGPAGLTQANSEPGGTINLIRKKPTTDLQTYGYVEAGRWNHYRTMLDTSNALNDDKTVRGRLVTGGETQDTFKNNVSSNEKFIYGVLDFDLTPSTLLRLGALYQENHQIPDFYGIPMGPNGQDTDLDASTYLGASWSKLNTKKTNLFSELEHNFNSDWKLTAKLNTNFNESLKQIGALANYSSKYAGYSATNTSLPINSLSKYDNKGESYNLNLDLNGKYNLFNQQHDLFVSASSSYAHDKSINYVMDKPTGPYSLNSFDIDEPDWSDVSKTATKYDDKLVVKQNALSLATRLNVLQDFHVLLGGRYTNYQSNYRYYTLVKNHTVKDNPTASKTDLIENKFIPYAGLTYDLTPNTSAYFSYTEIFKPQSNKTVDGTILPPVIGNNNEVGVKSAFYNGRLNTSLALFQIIQENRALTDVNNTDYFIADGKVQSRGIEAEISGQITDQLQLFAGYTFNKSKYLESENTTTKAKGTNYSAHTPEHMFRLSSQYQFSGDLNKLSAGIGLSAQSQTDSFYNMHQAGYTLWNANLRYDFTPNFSVNLIGQNLTNKRYYETNRVRTIGGNNYLGEPRNLLLRVDWKY